MRPKGVKRSSAARRIFQRQGDAAQVHDALAADFRGAELQLAFAGLEPHLAEGHGPEVAHDGFAVRTRQGVLFGLQRAVEGLDDPAFEQRALEGEFQRSPDGVGGAGVIQRDDVSAGGDDLDVPDGGVLGLGPVHEIGRVRRRGAPSQAAARLPVARRQHGRREFAVADVDGPRVDGVARSVPALALAFAARGRGDTHLFAPGRHREGEFLR